MTWAGEAETAIGTCPQTLSDAASWWPALQGVEDVSRQMNGLMGHFASMILSSCFTVPCSMAMPACLHCMMLGCILQQGAQAAIRTQRF